jgi:hypothetical protein
MKASDALGIYFEAKFISLHTFRVEANFIVYPDFANERYYMLRSKLYQETELNQDSPIKHLALLRSKLYCSLTALQVRFDRQRL